MERRDNYAIAAAQARQLFMNYDHEKLARKLRTQLDEDYLYAVMLGETYRIHRRTGDISRFVGEEWVSANSFGESLTLLDLVCDCKEKRCPAGTWRNMQDFGLQFHRSLGEPVFDPRAQYFQDHAEAFEAACVSLGGRKFHLGDAAFAFEVFDGMRVLLQLWYGDDEFPAQIRWLWDDNALQYIKYETMYYFIGLLLQKIEEKMK